MFSFGNAVLRLLGRQSPAPRWLAALAFVCAILAVLLACWSAWQAFDWFNDRDAVEKATNAANAEFTQDKDEATGRADIDSERRRSDNREQLGRTEELIDEALDKGCVISDYLASLGADCVQPAAVPSPAA